MLIGEIAFVIAVASIVLVLLSFCVGLDDFSVRDRVLRLLVRETTAAAAAVRLQTFRQWPRSGDGEDGKNDDVLVLFYKRLPILRAFQVSYTLCAVAAVSLAPKVIADLDVSDLVQTDQRAGLITAALGMFFLAIVLAIIISMWVLFFRGRLFASVQRLQHLHAPAHETGTKGTDLTTASVSPPSISKLEALLRREKRKRGVLWAVVTVLLYLLLATLALL